MQRRERVERRAAPIEPRRLVAVQDANQAKESEARQVSANAQKYTSPNHTFSPHHLISTPCTLAPAVSLPASVEFQSAACLLSLGLVSARMLRFQNWPREARTNVKMVFRALLFVSAQRR